jgi:hypothetical protein
MQSIQRDASPQAMQRRMVPSNLYATTGFESSSTEMNLEILMKIKTPHAPFSVQPFL